MIKRAAVLALVMLISAQITGCDSIQRKFTRKTKRKTISPKFYHEAGGETRPNLELYMTHYTYWKTWHEDLVKDGGRNAKRDKMAISEVLGNLHDMKKSLTDEKARELQVHIDETKALTDRVAAGAVTTASLENLKRKLDNVRARIVRKFYYKKVAEYILPD
jgi:polyhydroxyalkanoate synthesis regulator phasin